MRKLTGLSLSGRLRSNMNAQRIGNGARSRAIPRKLQMLRKLLYLIPFLLPLFLSSSASAETTAAISAPTPSVITFHIPGYAYVSSTDAVCATAYSNMTYFAGGSLPTALGQDVAYGYCKDNNSSFTMGVNAYMSCPAGSSVEGSVCSGTVWTCPEGQNWTLSGQTCTRPDCPEGTTRNSDGTCVNPCQSKIDQGTKFGIYTYPVGTSITGTYCDGGCRLALGSTAEPYYTDGKTQTRVLSQTYLIGSCTASDGTAPSPGMPGETPPDPPKPPPCAPTEGVMTSSTGAIHCVPAGIPGSNPPVVTKEKSVSTNPDGSTTTKETTTTRDPTTGAEEKTTTSTTRDGSGQVTSTSSDTTSKGTTQGGDPTKPENSSFCAENPDLQICKGGLNEEETQKLVKEGVEKVRDSLDAQDFNAESFFEGKDVSQAARDDVAGKLEIAKGEIEALAQGGPAAASMVDFESEMANWFEPISMSGCQAFTVHVGNWVWVHDHCDVAAKIAEMGAYCMWVLFAFGIFNMTTRDHR